MVSKRLRGAIAEAQKLKATIVGTIKATTHIPQKLKMPSLNPKNLKWWHREPSRPSERSKKAEMIMVRAWWNGNDALREKEQSKDIKTVFWGGGGGDHSSRRGLNAPTSGIDLSIRRRPWAQNLWPKGFKWHPNGLPHHQILRLWNLYVNLFGK